MHVLPLPFGLALALIPRRHAESMRRKEEIRPHLRNAIRPRDEILADVRYFNNVRGHV
jgi:hypothetical protein